MTDSKIIGQVLLIPHDFEFSQISGNYIGFRFELDGPDKLYYCKIRDWLTFTI